jgi:hypothetical protein
MRSDSYYDALYADCEKRANDLNISPADLPRLQRVPRRLDDGVQSVAFTSPKLIFRQRYVELIDHAESAIRRRFDQPGMELASLMESVLTRAASTGNHC